MKRSAASPSADELRAGAVFGMMASAVSGFIMGVLAAATYWLVVP